MVLKFDVMNGDRYLWNGEYGGELNKIHGNLCIEFETQMTVINGELINYIQKENIDQAIEVLEATYNNLDNKSLPKITSPYDSSFDHNFKIKYIAKNLEKSPCKNCD